LFTGSFIKELGNWLTFPKLVQNYQAELKKLVKSYKKTEILFARK